MDELVGPSTDAMVEIVLRGDSYERGVQYGKSLSKYLDRFYWWFVGREPKEILEGEYKSKLEDMEEWTWKYFPQLMEYIKGWSDGSGIEYDKCRILAFHNTIKRVKVGECSNILVVDKRSKRGWLGRNCDLFPDERSWQVFVIQYCSDCHSFAGTGYIGLPTVLGVNEKGLVVGGASLPVSDINENCEGLPNYSFYLLLSCDSVSSVAETLNKIPPLSGGGHIVVLDGKCDGLAIEIGGTEYALRSMEEGQYFIVATNHSITGRFEYPPSIDVNKHSSSLYRYDRLVEMLSLHSEEVFSVSYLKKVLGDHKGKFPVCRHGRDTKFHTIYSWVIEPLENSSNIYLCWGYPCESKFREIKVNW